MARRRNAIAHRFARMRGLPPEEKLLMQRIGDLMDSALNNRQSTNPFENARNITTRDIYPPTGILVKKGIKSIKIIWDPTPSNALLRYEIAFDNLTTGERTVKTSFINEVIFKATKGSYVARITSISRHGSTSLVKTVQFNAGDEVMQLEGGKNTPLELGTLVQDDIQHVSGYSMYVWGSVVLDKYVLANAVNPTATFRLWRAKGPDATFGDPVNPSVLQETIEMYAATESASNLDDTSRGGLITRPPAIAGRGGSFETSQSVMFSPIKVLASEDKDTFTYFLQAINRETDADEVNLSLTIWTGADGQGDAVPGDPFTPAPAYVFPHKNSFHSQIPTFGVPSTNNPALDARSLWASVPQSLNLIGNQHTIALWFRPDNLNADEMATGDNPTTGARALKLISRVAMGGGSGGGGITKENGWSIGVDGVAGGGGRHSLYVRYVDKDGSTNRNWDALSSFATGSNDDVTNLFPWGGAGTGSAAQNDAWYFIVICFEGGDFTHDDPSKIRVYMNTATHPDTGAPAMKHIPSVGSDAFENPIEQDDTNTHGYSIGDNVTDGGPGLPTNRNVVDGQYSGSLRVPTTQADLFYHQLGIWNVALDRSTAAGSNANLGGLAEVGLQNEGTEQAFVANSPIDYLFNAGFGTLVDWKEPSPLVADLSSPTGTSRIYVQNENLCHLIQFGAVEQAMSSGLPGRDTGNHYFKGDIPDTKLMIKQISLSGGNS